MRSTLPSWTWIPLDAYNFIQARLRGLLSSKTATDVTEAISVVVELRLRGAVGDGGWCGESFVFWMMYCT